MTIYSSRTFNIFSLTAGILTVLLLFLDAAELKSTRCPTNTKSCKIEGKLKCIPNRWWCDGRKDCDDLADEKECSELQVCHKESELQCGNSSLCFHKDWKCDGDVDCPKGDDELNCTNTMYRCRPSDRRCGSANQCFPKDHQCDTRKDCNNGFDEENCDNVTCDAKEFRCTSGQCILGEWKCDGDADCADRSDEVCQDAICKNRFLCPDKKKCIDYNWVCDNQRDCEDGADEKNCSVTTGQVTCHTWEFTCKDGVCIDLSWKCDGTVDCNHDGGSDELNCPTPCNSTTHFFCDEKKCLAMEKKCDGISDCKDGSDEPISCNVGKRCLGSEFQCKNDSKCISTQLTCNNKSDCTDGSDEDQILCNLKPCKIDAAFRDSPEGYNCSHGCSVVNGTHFKCTCRHGYELSDGVQCVDIDECNLQSVRYCSQTCINVPGSYACACIEGYRLIDKHHCEAVVDPKMLFADRINIKQLSLKKISDKNSMYKFQKVIVHTNNSIALDYGYVDKLLFWSDEVEHGLFMGNFSDDFLEIKFQKRLNVTVVTPDGMAYDWINKNLYWTDTGANLISVINVPSEKSTTLFSKDLDEPRAIVVDPRHGLIFWTDWGAEAKIERSTLNGKDRRAIITNDIAWPNGLTIDYVTNTLYWIEARLNSLYRCNMDGSNKATMLRSNTYLNHGFSVSVFEDRVYWSDWFTETIYSANKWDASDIVSVSGNHHSVMDIHVLHYLRQPKAEFYCQVNKCSHICLPSQYFSTVNYTCHCPPNVNLASDNFTCASSLSVAAPSKVNKLPTGHVTLIVIGILLLLALIVGVFGYTLYRSLQFRTVRNMNFDNPIYRKSSDKMEQVCLDQNQFQPIQNISTQLDPLYTCSHEVDC